MGVIVAGQHSITTSNEDRVLFPREGITKGEVIRYYAAIAPYMVPHLRRRRLTMQRYHKGIDEPGVFQKDIPAHFPEWVHRITVPKHGGTVTHVLCDNADTLVYLANQGCLTPHIGLSRIDRMEFPDQMMFDLDPPGEHFEIVRSVAFSLREVLESIGLMSFLKTSGSRGVHVVVPLDRRTKFDDVRGFAYRIADVLVRRRPDDVTLELLKKNRGSRLFLDTNRNATAQTVVAPFAVRARDGAPVSMPIAWEELSEPGVNARCWNIRNACRRVRNAPDPWRGFSKHARSLRAAADRISKL